MIVKRLTPHFTETELRCRCRRPECDAVPMDQIFMQRLEALRVEWGKPLLPTSGQRCEFQNRLVGGAPDSYHLKGRAVDFWFQDTEELARFETLAAKFGMNGLGSGRHLIHCDNRPSMARWHYADK